MKLHTLAPHESRICPIDFGVNRSKVKVIWHWWLKITDSVIHLWSWNFIHLLSLHESRICMDLNCKCTFGILHFTSQTYLVLCRIFLIHNSLEHETQEIVHILVDTTKVKVTERSSGKVIPHQISPVWNYTSFRNDLFEVGSFMIFMHLVFVLSVFMSVSLWLCLAKKKLLAITFEPCEIDIIFCMHTQLMINPFKWHQGQLPFDLNRDLYSNNSQFGLCYHWEHWISYFTRPLVLHVLCPLHLA